MAGHPIESILGSSVENIKAMVDADTIIGKSIVTPDGTTIIPVSKVSFGFGVGGSEFPSKSAAEAKMANPFGGGSGAGVSLIPVGFLVIKNGETKFLQVNDTSGALERFISMLPELADRVESLIKNKSAEKKPDGLR